MAYGLRLISSTLLQVAPELEEAARSTGASRGQITRHVTVPLSRYGLIGSWLLMFLIFEREYSTGGLSALSGHRNHRFDAGVAVGGGGLSISLPRSPLLIFCWWSWAWVSPCAFGSEIT
ncbi:Ferric iron ABC transporter [Klebsiella michiganensis]|uniref:Ferric iron ABC transporter n=1 Tax=Klebsiella michiganensis TaxID=1134687 RepID=A0A7H4PLG1_9ENTR|nr:Ferric iron ABC transporter [Klebsiella michiganensis]